MIDTNAYEKMTWETPSDELEDAVGNLLAEVKRLRDEKFTKRQLKLILYCLGGEYSNVEGDLDYPWHIWSLLGYGDRDEAKMKSNDWDEIYQKDEQALAELQEVMVIVKRMEEEE